MKLVIAATGASGTIYLQRLLAQIDCAANEVHLMMSGHAKQVAAQEVERLKQEVAQTQLKSLTLPEPDSATAVAPVAAKATTEISSELAKSEASISPGPRRIFTRARTRS